MTVEIFHLHVESSSYSNKEVFEIYNKISIQQATISILDVLLRPEYWSVRGVSYKKVAEIEGVDLDMAFELTNNIESSWTTNKGVKCESSLANITQGCRSTSVGDLLKVDGGHFMLVSSFGFKELPLIENF